ncbi:peptide deformylase [Rhizobium halophytocola]|uniref:Peptide deformylase-like n=1 Tax=Rhizobium halophytocola TaxID=735519 RepID=A0ABS4DZN4_9HYPH|nr:peptide deformylase [Rhizobium halophytocola]MBP1851162.1 peptide deformylase [Rhizobium halophytocola]
MQRAILTFPDPGLTRVASPVIAFDPALQTLADDLFDTMRAAPGVGITAPHIGVAQRLVVLDLPALGGRRDFANPQILSVSGTLMRHDEGSVSMPGMVEALERPDAVRLRYQDLQGNGHETELQGFPAICMQHEIDQLDGIFWILRLSRLKRERLLRRWEKHKRGQTSLS